MVVSVTPSVTNRPLSEFWRVATKAIVPAALIAVALSNVRSVWPHAVAAPRSAMTATVAPS